MIETLHELATEAGMKSVNVSIQSESSTKVALSIQCVPLPLKEKASEEQIALRDALSTPIIVKGLPGEVEAKMDSMIGEFKKTVTPRVRSLESQLEDIRDKTAAKPKKETEGYEDSNVTESLDDADAAESRFTDSNTTAL